MTLIWDVYRILLLDDDLPFLMTLEDLLTQDGHSVFPATCGREAVEIVRRVPLDLSFLDIDLPQESGIEVLCRIHEERPALPAIFITGNPAAGLEEAVLKQGGFALLRKPLDPGLVRGVMRQAVGRRH